MTPTTRRTPRSSAPAPTYADQPWLSSYPPDVPADVDVPAVPLTRLLDDAAASFPTTVALAFLGTRITYRDLKDSVDRFATALAGLGVKKGDRLAIVLPNCPQNVIAFFAALRLGAVVVQNNPLYTEHELEHQLADCGAEVVVCLDKTYPTVAAVRQQTKVREVVVTSVVDYLPTKDRLALRLPIAKAKAARADISARIPKGAPVRSFLRLLTTARVPARQVPIDPKADLALLQYTGGTTGLSKGAMLTHHNLVANAHQNKLWLPDVRPGREVTLAVLPLFHAYGLTVCMTTTILLGGTLVLIPRFDLDRVFKAIDEHRPTLFPGVPPIYQALLGSPKLKQHDLKSIKACISGAMKLPVEVAEQFEKASGGRLVEGYGMTETSPSTHANPIFGKRKAGTVGLPLPGTACTIVDPDDATKEVPFGTPGELAIAGPQVFQGYWQRPEESAAAFTADGYVLTGDIAVMDDDGYFSIVDRKKELIIAGGFNVYPSEVEEVLFTHPAIADVCVVGVPDRYRGETVKAFVVLRDGASLTADELTDFAAESLTAYKVPKLVEFRDALPRTVVGKVLRRVLLEEEKAKAAAPAAEEKPARKAPAKKAPAKKAPARKATPAKPAEPAKKPVAKKAAVPAKKPAAKATSVKKAPVKRAPAKKAPAKKAPKKAE